jgi:hypothetical protein
LKIINGGKTQMANIQIADINPSNSGLLYELTEAEVLDISGAIGFAGSLGGAAIGAIGNIGYQIGRGSWSWGSFGLAVGSGAITGFTGGAAAWYFVPRLSFGLGFTGGLMHW